MTSSNDQNVKNHFEMNWLVLVLVVTLVLSSIDIPVISYHVNNITTAVTHDNLSDVSTQNRIALVKPVFSATAYSNAFYTFYNKYRSVLPGEYVTTDLNLLNTTVVDEWKWSERLSDWFEGDSARSLHLVLGETVTLINEIDVDDGELFRDGVRQYDVLILGFTEYVTEREYFYYRQFVASGGTLIILDACNFLAEVTYSNGYLSLKKGHGWEFNGTHAWKSVYHRWYDENVNWVGGNYWRYWTGKHYDRISINTTNALSDYISMTLGKYIPTAYKGHEENILQNRTMTNIIGYWNFINASEYPGYPVAAYMHSYGKGRVIHSGIMGSEVILTDRFLPVFLAASIRLGLTGKVSYWAYPGPVVSADDYVEFTIVFYRCMGGSSSGTVSGFVNCPINLNMTTDVLRNWCWCNLHCLMGKMIKKDDEGYRVPYDSCLESKLVNETCWKLEINTSFFPYGENSLTINTTWMGIQSSLAINDFIGVLYFIIMKSWFSLILSWALPISAMMGVVVFTLMYNRNCWTRF